MTSEKPGITAQQEGQINALLDGELDETAAAELKTAAAKNSALAQAIVDAWQLQMRLDGLKIEKAPASLRRKLKRIPSQQQQRNKWSFGIPQWLLAGGLATASLLLVLVLSNEATTTPVHPQTDVAVETISDEQRAQQTAHELQIAFRYLDEVGIRVSKQINHVLSEEISTPVKDNFSKYMPYTGHSKKEKQA